MDNLIKEDFKQWLQFGYHTIPNFEIKMSGQFKLKPMAIKNYLNGDKNPHENVMQEIIEWIQEQ